MSREALGVALIDIVGWLRRLGLRYQVAGSLPRRVSLAETQADIYVPMAEEAIDTFLKGAETYFMPRFEVRRSSRGLDYLILSRSDWSVDLVPVATADDCSILHATYFSRRTLAECIEVLEFKTLLKSLGLYGADAAVEGFSGFLVELIVAQVGGLGRLELKALARFLGGRIVDPCNRSRHLERALFAGNIARLLAHLAGVSSGTGPIYRFKAETSAQKDFPGARRYLSTWARHIPLQLYTRDEIFYLRTPITTYRLWRQKSPPWALAALVRQPLFLNDRLAYYQELTFELNRIPGLVAL